MSGLFGITTPTLLAGWLKQYDCQQKKKKTVIFAIKFSFFPFLSLFSGFRRLSSPPLLKNRVNVYCSEKER